MDATYTESTKATEGAWGAVLCMSLMTFVLIASEFLPVSLLTPIARDLAITEGQAGQAIAISGFFAVLTSLFGNLLLSKVDRRTVVLLYTATLLASGIAITFSPDGLVFMLGRALLGISVGGFWSLSTAIVARLVPETDLPKALAMLQGGTALAAVIAAPLGSFLGGLIGWRGAFFVVVPVSLVGFAWQFWALPKMPPRNDVTVASMFRLLGNRTVLLGMAATTLAFMGQFSLSTYFRPFLEGVMLGAALLIASAVLAISTMSPKGRSGTVQQPGPAPRSRRETWDRAVSGGLSKSLDWAATSLIDQISPSDERRRK